MASELDTASMSLTPRISSWNSSPSRRGNARPAVRPAGCPRCGANCGHMATLLQSLAPVRHRACDIALRMPGDDAVVEADYHRAEICSRLVRVAPESRHDVVDCPSRVCSAVHAHDRAIMAEATGRRRDLVSAADL